MVKATKIRVLASDWESLLTKALLPKQAIMGLVLHRLTGKISFSLLSIEIVLIKNNNMSC